MTGSDQNFFRSLDRAQSKYDAMEPPTRGCFCYCTDGCHPNCPCQCYPLDIEEIK